jgi:hypothetical protein
MHQTTDHTADLPASRWWERRRLRYNVALIASIILGYMAYVAVVTHFEDVIAAPWVDENGTVIGNDIEFGGIAVIFQCCGASLGLLLATLFYYLGAGVERLVPPARVATYRKWAWRAGLAFSCFLPFSIALLHLFFCLFFPSWYDRTPIRFDGGPAGA